MIAVAGAGRVGAGPVGAGAPSRHDEHGRRRRAAAADPRRRPAPRTAQPRATAPRSSPSGCSPGASRSALVAALTGTDSVFTEQGLFFSGAALVTFGGAYAVLAYVAQKAVEVYGWLAPGEMVRGLALAETTPAR